MLDFTKVQNLEAEQAVLAAALNNGKASVALAASQLTEGDFVRLAHRKIFKAMVDLEARGDEVTPVTVADLLSARDELDEAGGFGYLTTVMENRFAVIGFESHVRIVARLGLQRRIAELSEVAAQSSTAPQEDFEAYLESVSSLAAKVQALANGAKASK